MMPSKESISKAGLNIAKLLILLALLLIIGQFTFDSFSKPYSYYIIGALTAVFLYVVFVKLREVTRRRGFEPYNADRLTTNNQQLVALMIALHSEIHRFQDSVSYYFFNVRNIKYSTAILAGISTVVLGIDLAGVKMPYGLDWTKLAKNIALIIGTIITIISTMAVFWNLEKYWLQNKIILQKFRQLREDIEFADKRQPLSPEEVNAYCEKFKTIKNEFYKYWEGVQADKNK